MKLIYIILPVFFLESCIAQPVEKIQTNKDDNTLLWEISGNDLSKPSYLFGTFHLMCKEDIRFSNELKQAIKNVSKVYFEMDLGVGERQEQVIHKTGLPTRPCKLRAGHLGKHKIGKVTTG